VATLLLEAISVWQFWRVERLGERLHAREHFAVNVAVAGGLLLIQEVSYPTLTLALVTLTLTLTLPLMLTLSLLPVTLVLALTLATTRGLLLSIAPTLTLTFGLTPQP